MPVNKKNISGDEARLLTEVQEHAMFLLDREGTILSWNKGSETMLGYTEREIVGKSHRIFYIQEDNDRQLPDLHLAETSKSDSLKEDGWRLRKDGGRFWASMSITALRGENKELRGFLKVISDLSAIKRSEEQAIMHAEQLRESNDALRISEEKYHKMIAEVSDYAIILLDEDGTILDWNKGAEKIKLYKPAEIIGRNFRAFYLAEDRAARLPEQLLEQAQREGTVHHEGWRVRKDGTRFWGSVSISALHGQDGELLGYSKVTRDLTERKRTEDRLNASAEGLRQANEALRRSEEQHHKMISEVRDYAIIMLDKDGNILNWNAGAEHIKQWTASEAIGKNFRIFYTDEDLVSGLPERLLAEAENYGRASHEGWRVKKDGSKFWGSIIITALHGDSGELLGFSKVTRDLTARKRAEDELRENAHQLDHKNKMLERLNEELESFNYVASHDLKEPLRKIQTFVNLIERNGDIPESTAGYLEKIKSSAERSYVLIEDLLSLSRVSNDKSRFQVVDLNEVVARAKEDLDLTIREKNARIYSETLPVISGVSFQLEQLFINLISNGLKFSKQDPLIRITYATGEYASPDSLMMPCHQIAVIDNGVGFEQQYASLIFGAFQRLETNGTAAAGTGIGLAIVRKVMQNHGGWVSAEGRPGEGATFSLFFPAVAAVLGSSSDIPQFAAHHGAT